MDLAIGIALALGVGVFASIAGLDRSRAFYPVVAMVVASYYVLFAVMGGSRSAIVIESAAGLVFVALAVLGFKRTLWLAVIALAGHGLFDCVHASIVSNPGVPSFWPGFCAAYDVTAAGYLAWLLSRRTPAAP